MKPITIVGGGICGLALGIALRHHDVPTKLYDSGTYPRHRVCGEFICGATDEVYRDLHIEDIFSDAHRHSSTSWHYQGKPVFQADLPVPALGMSRYLLDQRLARRFTKLGGTLHDDTPFEWRNESSGTPGLVWANGRVVESSPWIGLKIHLTDLAPLNDLELHLGNHAYAGLSAVESNRMNACGLFRKRPGIRARKETLFFEYLKASGLSYLAERLQAAKPDPASAIGVSSIRFGPQHLPDGKCHLGDHYTAIPPFTGNGMSMALECAWLAWDPLVKWSRDHLSWEQCLQIIHRQIRQRFTTRLQVAQWVHPLLYTPGFQPLLATMARFRILPFQSIYSLTH